MLTSVFCIFTIFLFWYCFFGPSAGQPVAMGYVETAFSAVDTALFAEVRGKQLPVTVSKMPFVPQRYYRGE